jgi:D-alanyl-lipoteichoic acid acyltransferase DltB (MBOAT superfamily)
MRPFRSFLLLLISLASLSGLYYLFPGTGLFPSAEAFIPKFSGYYLKHSGITEQQPAVMQIRDSVRSSYTTRILPAGIGNNLPYLFLDSLRSSKGQIRIMYYGDSQIEGDRITFSLRQALRKERGGTGPGLFLPVMPVMYTKSLWLRSSSNWERYNYLSYKNGEITHDKLGPFMAICRYLPEGVVSPASETATVKISPSNYADNAASTYDILRIFYANQKGEVGISVKADDRQILADSLKNGTGIQEISCDIKGSKEIMIVFEGKVSPDIYGISIESKAGVIVDNIPQRGSAGLEFTMVDRNNLKESYRLLSPDLIILHYGLNIVKNVRNEYSYYKRGLIRQLSLLKEVAPLTRVLVAGVTDMAFNEGDSVVSYSNIPAIIKAQREAAIQTGAAFWDSYKAMGGRSSVIKWAEREPPLAQKDYVHFTYPGADTLSRMLAEAMFLSEATDTLHKTISYNRPDMIVTPSPGLGRQLRPGNNSAAGSFITAILNYDPDKPFIFTTAAFWIFFLLVLAGYSLVYKKLLIRNIYLFLISLFFYYKTGGMFLFILIFVTVVDYSCGLLINRSKRNLARKFFVFLSIVSNLGLLGYFKYTGFIINTINDIFGTQFKVYDFLSAFSNSILGTSFDISYIILPVGISFFTFQSLSYTIDIYRRKMEPVRNIIDFGFYVSFFPHLVAGPIVRASFFIPQIYQEFRLSRHEFSHALYMISKGLIKKIVISNFIAINLVDRVFDAPAIYSGFENLMAIYGYGLQIYCDFSGYTDIAIGVALILGFRLPINFNSPYKAKNITDFWKRWHISLSQWLRDYLYISLGGNRKGKIRTYLNLMITMLLGGLWHGASLRFIIWGGLHGIGLVINKLWSSLFRSYGKTGWIGRVLAIFITFNFVNFCWIFFRAPDMDNAILMLNQIAENFSPGSFLTVIPAYSSVYILMAVGYIIHFLPESVKESYRGFFIRMPLYAQMVIILLIAVMLYQMRTADVIPFIYFRF